MKCDECRFGEVVTKMGYNPTSFKYWEYNMIKCHRFPGSEQPLMWPLDWCGEFQPEEARE